MNSNPILLIHGEPKSIFLEIFFKSLRLKFKRPLVLIASKNLLIKEGLKLKYNFNLNLIKKEFDNKSLIKNKINLINVDIPKIKNKNSNKAYIEKCFKIALEILKEKKTVGLINGPISKKKFLNGKFPGITEYLASKTKKNNVVMLIFNKILSVSPITTHLPLVLVKKNITKKKIINHINLINSFYKKIIKKKPKIAVTGLNPHCEGNFNLNEENKIIEPAIKHLKKKIKVFGPFPADTIFLRKNRENYDVIVGMYHDQVLTPIKAIFEFNAINITLGLPFIRISPDHGPNEKMFGKNLSNPESLIKAIKFLDQ